MYIQDNHRTVRGNVASESPDHLAPLLDEDKWRDAYALLREHFRYAIAWRSAGGDIMDDEDIDTLLMTCHELYREVEDDEICHAADSLPEDVADERWNTLAGELVHEYIKKKPNVPVVDHPAPVGGVGNRREIKVKRESHRLGGGNFGARSRSGRAIGSEACCSEMLCELTRPPLKQLVSRRI